MYSSTSLKQFIRIFTTAFLIISFSVEAGCPDVKSLNSKSTRKQAEKQGWNTPSRCRGDLAQLVIVIVDRWRGEIECRYQTVEGANVIATKRGNIIDTLGSFNGFVFKKGEELFTCIPSANKACDFKVS